MGCVVKRGDLEFVFMLLQQLDLGRLSKPGPVPAISEGEVREIKVVFPPLPEQQQLISFVRKQTKQLDDVLTRTEREIGLLREYRTRLVADVVTGKLDVRAAARHLPAHADEPEAAIPAEDFPAEVELEPEATE
jgi:type I restriction enzyme S subunit